MLLRGNFYTMIFIFSNYSFVLFSSIFRIVYPFRPWKWFAGNNLKKVHHFFELHTHICYSNTNNTSLTDTQSILEALLHNVTYCVSEWQTWTAAGSCGWGNAASGSVGGGCGAAGKTAPAAALPGFLPHCWSLAPTETVMCSNLERHSKTSVKTCPWWSKWNDFLSFLKGWRTYSVLWPWLQIEAWWGSGGGCDGNCGCWSVCWLEEVLHLNRKSEER